MNGVGRSLHCEPLVNRHDRCDGTYYINVGKDIDACECDCHGGRGVPATLKPKSPAPSQQVAKVVAR